MISQIANIFDLLDGIGEEGTRELLSSFSCPKNPEVEHFVLHNAINFAQRKIAVTYCMMDDNADLLAIFSLAHKAVTISGSDLSSGYRKKLQRFARFDEQTCMFTASAFLIAQLGKNYALGVPDLSGDEMMDAALDILEGVQRQIGGGIVYLECEDITPLLYFYTNKHNRFIRFGERQSGLNRTKYIQLFRFL